MKEELQYDELLGQYLDKDGKVYEGIKEVDIDEEGASAPYKSDLQQNLDRIEQEKQQNQLVAVHNTITTLEEQLKTLKRQEEEVKQKLLKGMQDNDIWQIKTENVTISRKKEYERTTIDTKAFQEEMPDIANQFKKDVKVGEHIEIRIKK